MQRRQEGRTHGELEALGPPGEAGGTSAIARRRRAGAEERANARGAAARAARETRKAEDMGGDELDEGKREEEMMVRGRWRASGSTRFVVPGQSANQRGQRAPAALTSARQGERSSASTGDKRPLSSAPSAYVHHHPFSDTVALALAWSFSDRATSPTSKFTVRDRLLQLH